MGASWSTTELPEIVGLFGRFIDELNTQAKSFCDNVVMVATEAHYIKINEISRDILEYANNIKKDALKVFEEWQSNGAGFRSTVSSLEAGDEAEEYARSQEEGLRQLIESYQEMDVSGLDGISTVELSTPGEHDIKLVELTKKYMDDINDVQSKYERDVEQKKNENIFYNCIGSLISSIGHVVSSAMNSGAYPAFQQMVATFTEVNAAAVENANSAGESVVSGAGRYSEAAAAELISKTKNRWKKHK